MLRGGSQSKTATQLSRNCIITFTWRSRSEIVEATIARARPTVKNASLNASTPQILENPVLTPMLRCAGRHPQPAASSVYAGEQTYQRH